MGIHHLELKSITVFSGSNILKACFLYVSALARTSSRVSLLRASDLPDGSPIIPVKSPIRNITLCPMFWKCLILRSSTVCPRWISGAVGSKPAFMLRGVFSRSDFSSFFLKSSMGIISSVPLRSSSKSFFIIDATFFKNLYVF